MSNREGSSKNPEGATCPHDEGAYAKRRTWEGKNKICGKPTQMLGAPKGKGGRAPQECGVRRRGALVGQKGSASTVN